ncbi:hypothetical protein [Pseudofrankia inefficax]|uniref:Uncharacterized protein n=1 Tax=Pseudofrankia inefficax (strain DSM 45817 / CECT 9037 / DDB 130130 / EuI1c) TaxID=298654 RepID=E3JDP8_PSEI1|nr:hypothetical protein [Pseudofrankia inefficax]ADP84814.1 hypothetical protein FraEuI1c_6845 [Pseudofrankia inefficax]
MDGRRIASLTRRWRAPRAKGGRWLAVPALVLALGACGTSGTSAAQSGNATTAGSGASAGTASSAMSAYTSCLAQNGVTLPTPSAGPGGGAGQGGTPPSAQGGTRPQGARPSGSPPSGMPNGGQDAGAPGGGAPGGALSTAAPAGVDAQTWAKARTACASLAPTPPAGQTAAPSAQPTS